MTRALRWAACPAALAEVARYAEQSTASGRIVAVVLDLC
jgi:hypothetical protein